jgi:hypothetical protein
MFQVLAATIILLTTVIGWVAVPGSAGSMEAAQAGSAPIVICANP